MPGPTAGLAHLGARDPHPLEPLRLVDHLPQQLAVGRLEVGTLHQHLAGLGDPLG
jgi:hypothetical protein